VPVHQVEVVPQEAARRGIRGRLGRGQQRLALLQERLHHLGQQLLLGGEVVVERRLGDLQPLGDLAQAGVGEPLLREELQRGLPDLRPGVGVPPRHGAPFSVLARPLCSPCARPVNPAILSRYLPTGKLLAGRQVSGVASAQGPRSPAHDRRRPHGPERRDVPCPAPLPPAPSSSPGPASPAPPSPIAGANTASRRPSPSGRPRCAPEAGRSTCAAPPPRSSRGWGWPTPSARPPSRPGPSPSSVRTAAGAPARGRDDVL